MICVCVCVCVCTCSVCVWWTCPGPGVGRRGNLIGWISLLPWWTAEHTPDILQHTHIYFISSLQAVRWPLTFVCVCVCVCVCCTYPGGVEGRPLTSLLFLAGFHDDAGHSSCPVSELQSVFRRLWWKLQHPDQQQGALPVRQHRGDNPPLTDQLWAVYKHVITGLLIIYDQNINMY